VVRKLALLTDDDEDKQHVIVSAHVGEQNIARVQQVNFSPECIYPVLFVDSTFRF
jgi:hypothetical protein